MDHFLKNSLFTYQGVAHINVSVPIFPLGEGWENALLNLANYPLTYTFYEIYTEGVHCSFASTLNPQTRKRLSDEIIYELAFFPEDLIELQKRNYITGLHLMTEYEWKMLPWKDHPERTYTHEPFPGDIREVSKPDFKEEVEDKLGEQIDVINDEVLKEYNSIIEDDLYYYKKFIEYPKGIKITSLGKKKVFQLTQDFEVPDRIKQLIEPLIEIKYFATAVREVAIDLEYLLYNFHKERKDFKTPRLFGQDLIELHIEECKKANDRNFNAGLKLYRQELLTLNRFVRNPFMHGKKDVQKDHFNRILFRQCRVYEIMEQAFKKLLE